MRFNFAVIYVNVVTLVAVFSQTVDDFNNNNNYSSSSFGKVNMAEMGAHAERFETDLRYQEDNKAIRLRVEMLG